MERSRTSPQNYEDVIASLSPEHLVAFALEQMRRGEGNEENHRILENADTKLQLEEREYVFSGKPISERVYTYSDLAAGKRVIFNTRVAKSLKAYLRPEQDTISVNTDTINDYVPPDQTFEITNKLWMCVISDTLKHSKIDASTIVAMGFSNNESQAILEKLQEEGYVSKRNWDDPNRFEVLNSPDARQARRVGGTVLRYRIPSDTPVQRSRFLRRRQIPQPRYETNRERYDADVAWDNNRQWHLNIKDPGEMIYAPRIQRGRDNDKVRGPQKQQMNDRQTSTQPNNRPVEVQGSQQLFPPEIKSKLDDETALLDLDKRVESLISDAVRVEKTRLGVDSLEDEDFRGIVEASRDQLYGIYLGAEAPLEAFDALRQRIYQLTRPQQNIV